MTFIKYAAFVALVAVFYVTPIAAGIGAAYVLGYTSPMFPGVGYLFSGIFGVAAAASAAIPVVIGQEKGWF